MVYVCTYQQRSKQMTDLPTIETAEVAKTPNFSGVVHYPWGVRHYAAMVNGKYLRTKAGQLRRFKYEMEAGRAAYAAMLADESKMQGGEGW